MITFGLVLLFAERYSLFYFLKDKLTLNFNLALIASLLKTPESKLNGLQRECLCFLVKVYQCRADLLLLSSNEMNLIAIEK